MLLKERIRGSDNDHVKLMQKDNQLTAMSRCVVKMMVACLGGPPLVTITDVSKITAYFTGLNPTGIYILRI